MALVALSRSSVFALDSCRDTEREQGPLRERERLETKRAAECEKKERRRRENICAVALARQAEGEKKNSLPLPWTIFSEPLFRARTGAHQSQISTLVLERIESRVHDRGRRAKRGRRASESAKVRATRAHRLCRRRQRALMRSKKKKKAADEEKRGLSPPSANRCVVPTMVAMLCV